MHLTTQTRFRLQLSLAWLLIGTMLALALPVLPSNSLLGWTGIYWLLAAPASMALLLARSVLRATSAPLRIRLTR